MHISLVLSWDMVFPSSTRKPRICLHKAVSRFQNPKHFSHFCTDWIMSALKNGHNLVSGCLYPAGFCFFIWSLVMENKQQCIWFILACWSSIHFIIYHHTIYFLLYWLTGSWWCTCTHGGESSDILSQYPGFCRNIQVAYLGFSICKSTHLFCAIHAPQKGQQFWKQKRFSIQDIRKEFSYLRCIYYHLTRGTGIWKPLLPKCTAPVLTVLFKGAWEHYFLKMLLTQVTHGRMNHYHALMAKSLFTISLLV